MKGLWGSERERRGEWESGRMGEWERDYDNRQKAKVKKRT